MIRIPKQIINKINYFVLDYFLKSRNQLILNFEHLFKNTFRHKNRKIFFLGRARYGIFLSVKNILRNSNNNLVLLSSFTIPAVIDLVKKAGGKPYFVDFEKDSLYLDLSLIKKLIINKKPAALLITHYHVVQKHLNEIVKLCKKNNVKLIEDCAIYMSNSNSVGLKSDYSIFSFSSFKIVNFFFGGAISIRKKIPHDLINNLIKKEKKLNFCDYSLQIFNTWKFSFLTQKFFFHFITFELLKFKKKFNEQKNYEDKYHNFNKQPSSIAIASINSKIKKYYIEKKKRQYLAKIYYKLLKSICDNHVKVELNKGDFFHFVVFAKNKVHRDFIKKKCLENNFDIGTFFYPNCHKISNFKKIKGFTRNAEDIKNRIILLPTHNRVDSKYAYGLGRYLKKIYYYDYTSIQI